ncbi:MAG: zinc metalloprotease HtpX [Chloroflexi bacterium]|nr:zinc metalloprotease HtpX [Chloroflexota bacterium]
MTRFKAGPSASPSLPADPGLTARIGLTMLLLAAVYAVFVTVLWAAGGSVFLIAIVVAGLAIAQYFYSDRLVLAAMRARVVDRTEAPELVDRIERLAAQFDLPIPRVAIIDADTPNALATGRDPSHSVIAVTTGLLSRLDGPELDAVLAHELSHVRHRDAAVLTMAAVFATVAAFIVQMGFWLGLAGGDDREDNGRPSIIVVYLVSIVVWLISFLLIRALSRYRELAADRGSAIMTGAPSQLASALVKISGAMERIPEADLRSVESASALMLVPAFSRRSFIGILATHPSLEDRLAQLRRLEAEGLER